MSSPEHWDSVIEFLKKELALVPRSQPTQRLSTCLQISSAHINSGCAVLNKAFSLMVWMTCWGGCA